MKKSEFNKLPIGTVLLNNSKNSYTYFVEVKISKNRTLTVYDFVLNSTDLVGEIFDVTYIHDCVNERRFCDDLIIAPKWMQKLFGGD